jgi:DNA-binding transcriptional LysR family regulator
MERTRARIRRLEEMVGTPLLRRRREGLVFTKTANVLLDASSNALFLVGREMSRTRQAVLRDSDPRFEVTGPPFRHSLFMALAVSATGDRPTALLTVPNVIAGIRPGLVLVSTLSPA